MTSLNVPTHSNFMKCLNAGLVFISLDDGGSAFSMLNRNLPMYMNWPYCQLSKNKKDPPEVKFAGTVSQLQRIFLVHNFASLFIHFPDFYVVSLLILWHLHAEICCDPYVH